MTLPPIFSKNKTAINIIIENPKGCAAKYNFDETTYAFKFKKNLRRVYKR